MCYTAKNNKKIQKVLDEIMKKPYDIEDISEEATELAREANCVIVFGMNEKLIVRGMRDFTGAMYCAHPINIHIEQLEPFTVNGFIKPYATLDKFDGTTRSSYYMFGTLVPSTPFFLYKNQEDYENHIPSCRGVIVSLDVLDAFEEPKITKEDFSNMLNAIKETNIKTEDFNTALNKFSDSFCCINLHSNLEAQVISLLNKLFHLDEKDDMISWWLYENVKKELYEDDYAHNVESLDNFYDYLSSQILFKQSEDDTNADQKP